MSSNRLHKLFDETDRLTRDDIVHYGKSSDESTRHEIEEKFGSNSFEGDAIEGWESVDYNTGLLAKADKRFLGKKGSALNYLLVAITLLAIASAAYFAISNKASGKETPISSKTEPAQNDVVLEKSDVLLPEIVGQMQEAPKDEQIKVSVIKEEYKERKNSKTAPIQFEVDELPLQELILEVPEPSNEVVKKRSSGKEIYLHDLKLLDYRKYRARPTIKIEQLILSGTPASLEQTTQASDEPNWKTVDIPYIEFLDKSIKQFAKGQNKRALSRFNTIMETYPDDLNANFYGGLCLYNLGEYSKAIDYFKTCLNSPFANFDEESLWMIANSYEKTNDFAKSNKVYQQIVSEHGFYENEARKKLNAN